MDVQQVSFPKSSLLLSSNYHYADSFKSQIQDIENEIDTLAAAKAFFSSSPKWIGRLLELRNKLVSIVGLKTGDKVTDRQSVIDNFRGVPGQKVGLFKVFNHTDNELVLGENDSHLDFRVSLLLDNVGLNSKDIVISTTVVYNNWFGRLYFFFVKPFHKIIVSAMLKSLIRELNSKTT